MIYGHVIFDLIQAFLLQIRPKLCYLIREYASLMLYKASVFEKLAKNPDDCGRLLYGRPLHRCPLHGRYRHQNQTEDLKLGILEKKVNFDGTP